jgi:hypothetical protein
MDALQYICMDIGARISSDIDKYVNPKKNLKEQFDEHRFTVFAIDVFTFQPF